MCEKVTGTKIPAIEKPRRPGGDPPKLVASAQKAIKNSAGNPLSQTQGHRSTAWAWHKKHPSGYAD